MAQTKCLFQFRMNVEYSLRLADQLSEAREKQGCDFVVGRFVPPQPFKSAIRDALAAGSKPRLEAPDRLQLWRTIVHKRKITVVEQRVLLNVAISPSMGLGSPPYPV